MNKPKSPIANPVVVLREEFDEWGVLYNPDTAHAVGINPVGIFIWRLMDGQHTLKQITDEVRENFSKVPDTVIDDVRKYIDSLEEKGFVGYRVAKDKK